MVKWSAADNWATGRKNGMIRMRGAAEREIIIMKYAIIGAGGTGGILGFYMTKAGKDLLSLWHITPELSGIPCHQYISQD